MTIKEFEVLCKGMKAVYTSPNFLPDTDSVKIWYQLLKDITYETANAAIQRYILTNKFPPTVADIREGAASVMAGEKPLWSDGWEEVLRAIRKFGYYRETDAMESFTETTREAVKRLGFRNICMSENIMTDRANFRMIFEEIAGREQKEKQMPAKLTQVIEQIRERNLLETN